MASPAAHSPGEVLLASRNSTSPTSTAIANYYALKRGVTNILAVSCQDSALNSGNEIISYSNYTSQIQTPISNYLSSHSGINFIIFKGIPDRIDNGASVRKPRAHSLKTFTDRRSTTVVAALGYSTANGNVKATIVGSGAQRH